MNGSISTPTVCPTTLHTPKPNPPHPSAFKSHWYWLPDLSICIQKQFKHHIA